MKASHISHCRKDIRKGIRSILNTDNLVLTQQQAMKDYVFSGETHEAFANLLDELCVIQAAKYLRHILKYDKNLKVRKKRPRTKK